MRIQAALFAEHVPQARPGADPEHVHITRVATRRMRAALRVFEGALPACTDGLHEELGWIGSQLGPVRDLDVQLKRLQSSADELGVADAVKPYAAWLDDQRQRAQVDFDEAHQSYRFAQLLERLRGLDEVAPETADDVPLATDAPRRLKRAYGKFRQRADQLTPSSPPPAFHRTRIAAKRLRYAAEFLEPLYGKPARRVVDSATAMQDLLGDHQDGVVDAEHIQTAVADAAHAWPAETVLALGRIVQWDAQHGETIRRGFKPMYRDVKADWRRLRNNF
jgi:CHAD domain-containing protein